MLQKSTELLREQLKSISFKDYEGIVELNGETISAVLSAYFYLEPVINELIQKQLKLIVTEVADLHQLAFLQGTINGLYVMKDWFDQQKRASLMELQEEENDSR